MEDILKISQEKAHAAHDSIGQVRKYSFIPYWHHPDEVRALFLKYLPNEIAGAIACDWHDVLEDVFPKNPFYSYEYILGEFGPAVAGHVVDVTDQYTKENYPQWNRPTRNGKERERQGLIHPVSKSIKLCDITRNTATIIEEDVKYAPTYLREKWLALPFLRGGASEQLWQDTTEHLIKQLNRLN